MNKRARAIFDHAHPKELNQLLAFLNLCQNAKNQFIPPVPFWNTVNFRVLWLDWPHPFLTMLFQIFDQLLIFVNLHERVKNQFILSVHSLQLSLDFCDQTRHTHFLNLCGFLLACKKSVNLIHSFLRH